MTSILNCTLTVIHPIITMASISEYEDAGLKIPHPESLIKIQRIACLAGYLDDNSSLWKVFLSHYLKDVGTSFLLQCNFDPLRLPCKLPIFYKECLEVWSTLMAITI